MFIYSKPEAPAVANRSKSSVSLVWRSPSAFAFLEHRLLYQLERREKIPPWELIYSGGRTSKTIDNLPPRHPHKFRLRAVLRASDVPALSSAALTHHGDVDTAITNITLLVEDAQGADENSEVNHKDRGWLMSQWSEETWTSTESDGVSAVCFCMAVRCGYIKQLQAMLEERPELIDIVPSNGLSPLATAVRKGDVNIVRFLLQAGADVGRPLAAGQTPLHLAVLAGHLPIIDLLLDNGADLQSRDMNGLRAEHYAADSGRVQVVRHVLARGGDINVRDHNGWTPLFRAICQGASTELVAELVARGSDVAVRDRAGLALLDAARLLRDHNGRRRESLLRVVDASYPREAALAHFARLTGKISNLHALRK
ncbi:fibronectin type 3 and ankyrin repeat domains 1 protein [Papilio machaon]|uniref:fibronectin type 3 and ankyrin repeat domains 1 protein n=1 Tax=Papilio machaon TaxID=76193 RepID=UPI001E66368C|nr:fibronectin type 3 and ankyrin repeat domains 1 protein [Papilio machaon]